jgi:hypothetical protein
MLPVAPARINFAVIGLLLTSVLFWASLRRPAPSLDQDLPGFPQNGLEKGGRGRLGQSTGIYTQDPSIYNVQNETLGFQEVYMISLPARSDKRDAFAMQAAVSGITYTQLEGVDGHKVPAKALPYVCMRPTVGVSSADLHLDHGPKCQCHRMLASSPRCGSKDGPRPRVLGHDF